MLSSGANQNAVERVAAFLQKFSRFTVFLLLKTFARYDKITVVKP